MVSYYNTLSYSQKHSAANLAYPGGQPWQWTANYHTPPNPNPFLGDMDGPHSAHQMYYNPHHMFHTSAPGAGAASEWHSPSHTDNFAQSAASAHQMPLPHHVLNGVSSLASNSSAASSGSSGSASAGPNSGNTNLNETAGSADAPIAEGLPSPPITVSGSEISSPGVPASSSSPHHLAAHHLGGGGGGGGSAGSGNSNNNNNSPSANNNNTHAINNNHRTSPIKPQYYDWMKKPSYPTQPAPGNCTEAERLRTSSSSHLEEFTDFLDANGKTRTKDKYRVVYTDFQRLELEKEYCTSRYITIRRKTELAQSLSLSERQVKIWFQNRRAKERKQNKKTNDPTMGSMGGMGGSMQHGDYVNLMESKPKLEPGLHLQHSLHPMSSMAAMSHLSIDRYHLHHSHHSLAAVSAAAAAHSHSHSHPLHHQSQHAMSAAAGASVGSLAM